MFQILLRFRRSARAFARAPRLSLALLLTIALGVGANASLYGFLRGLTRPASLPGGSGSIVSIFRQDRFRQAAPLSPHDYRQLKNSRDDFDWVGAARIQPLDSTIGDQAQVATVAAITPNLAAALSLPLDNGAVISHRMWQNEFGGRANALGSHLRIDKAEFKITGIAPQQLEGLYSDRSIDLWIPLHELDLQGDRRGHQELWVFARLRHGVSARQAQAALRSGSAGLADVSILPFTGIAPNMASGLSRVTAFLTFSAGAVFFIASINVASILLGRALKRSHETSLRVALGATRAELLRELLSDSVVISLAGGVLGLFLGILTAHALPAFLFREDAERLRFAPHQLPILAASMACIVITVICGMLPVLGTVTDRPWTVLQRETGSPSKAIRRLRSGLVAAQISACCMLIVCTALLLDGLHSALETSAGHRLGNAILLTVNAPTPDGPEVDPDYFSEVEKKAKSVAGLSPLAWTAQLPGDQPTWRTFRILPPSSQYRDLALDIAWLTQDSIGQLDNEPIAGKMFGIDDPTHRIAVVDEEAAAELFGRQTVGVEIRDSANQPIEIIGVVKRKSTNAIQQRHPTIYYGYSDRSDTPASVRHAQFRVPLTPPAAGVDLNANVVSANYFLSLGLQLIAGQIFPEHPVAGLGRVAIVNQEAADLYFNGKPIGARLLDESGVRTEITGVVRSQIFGTFEQHPQPTIYFPLWQDPPTRMTLILKDAKSNRRMLADLRKVESVPGRGSAPAIINTLEKQLAQSGLAALRIATLIGSASAITALILSILGMLSAQADAEYQRQREQALRIALGAQRWRIVLMVIGNAARLAIVGIGFGTLLSFVFLRLLVADIAVASPPLQIWFIAPLLSAAVVTLASLIPARRASLNSPLAIMREN